MAALGKNSARGALVHADRCARTHPGDIHSALCVITMIAVYMAIRHRGTLDLSKQMQMPATTALRQFLSRLRKSFSLATYTKEKLSLWRQSLVSQHCPGHVIVSAAQTSKACTHRRGAKIRRCIPSTRCSD